MSFREYGVFHMVVKKIGQKLLYLDIVYALQALC
jgi:hypothetical protein